MPREARDILEQQFLEMRWRALSLAADLDRIERAEGGAQLLQSDPRLARLRQAFGLLTGGAGNRAEQLQLILSDKSPVADK